MRQPRGPAEGGGLCLRALQGVCELKHYSTRPATYDEVRQILSALRCLAAVVREASCIFDVGVFALLVF